MTRASSLAVAVVLGACTSLPGTQMQPSAQPQGAPTSGGPALPTSPAPAPTGGERTPASPNGTQSPGGSRAVVVVGGETHEFTEGRCTVDDRHVTALMTGADDAEFILSGVGLQSSFMRLNVGGSRWVAGSSTEPIQFTVAGSTATWSGPVENRAAPSPGQILGSVELTCQPTAPTGPPDGSLPMGRLLFSARPDLPPASLDIWLLEAGSQSPVRVTSGATDRLPAWGPDGDSAIFASDRIGFDSAFSDGVRAFGIYVVGFDDGEPVHLFGERSFSHSPKYSPDSTQLMFWSDRGGDTQIYVVDADSAAGSSFGDWTPLTDFEFAAEGDWSPDGTRIAFSGIVDGNRDIYVMDADGSNVTRLTDHPGRDDAPDWSPDGTKIAFMSEMSGTETDLYVMDADGGNLTQLTFDPVSIGYPSWSPDGQWIAYDRQEMSGIVVTGIDILVMRADGSEVLNITRSLPLDAAQFPAWGP